MILFMSAVTNAQLLNNPESVVFDSARHCYLVSNWAEGSGEIVRIDSNGTQSYFSTALQGQYQIAGLYIYGDTLLAAAGNAPGAGVAAFELETGNLLYFISIPGIGLPNDITSDASRIVYVTDYWGNKLYKIIDRTPYLFMSHGLGNPNGIMYDELYHRLLIVSCTGSGYPILQLTLEDSALSTLVVTALPGGDGITMDNERNLYFCEWGNDAVYRYDSTFTGDPTLFSSGHDDPADIYFDRVHSVLAVPNFSSNTVDFVPIVSSATEERDKGILPQHIQLHQNWPNPFNPVTHISYDMANAGHVTLTIFDMLGREIKTIVNETQSMGNHSVILDGSELSSGIYFCRLQAGSFVATKKMVLLK
jgi:hypothetical protein